MLYRPPGWDNPWDMKHWELDLSTLKCSQKTSEGGRVIEDLVRRMLFDEYEASADAMIGALFKLAEESPTGTFIIDSHTVNTYSAEAR